MMTKVKWFAGVQTLDQLKSMYKKLAKQHHPDLGGSVEDMAEINAEYDGLSMELPKVNSKGETYQPKERECPELFRAAVIAVQNMTGVDLELCGEWLWASGNTKVYKDVLSAAGYRWSANKSAWYWHADGYRRKNGKKWSMAEIRDHFGSESIRAEERPAIA